MKQRCIIYTTTTTGWIEDNLPFIKSTLNMSKGRTVEDIVVETISPPSPKTHTGNDGKTRISWDWFTEFFEEKAEGYDVVVLHFTEHYRSKWGISSSISGSYKSDSGNRYKFWVCADKHSRRKGYWFDNFTRIFLHEWAHGDGYIVPIPDQKEYVHDMDYEKTSVHRIFSSLDFTRYNLEQQLIGLIKKLLSIYKKML